MSFRHLDKHGLGEQISYFVEDFVYATVKAPLSQRGMTMGQCSIVNPALIAAASSIKNKKRKRDP